MATLKRLVTWGSQWRKLLDRSFSFSSISLCVARVSSIILKPSESIFHQFFCYFEVDRNPGLESSGKHRQSDIIICSKTKMFYLVLSAAPSLKFKKWSRTKEQKRRKICRIASEYKCCFLQYIVWRQRRRTVLMNVN